MNGSADSPLDALRKCWQSIPKERRNILFHDVHQVERNSKLFTEIATTLKGGHQSRNLPKFYFNLARHIDEILFSKNWMINSFFGFLFQEAHPDINDSFLTAWIRLGVDSPTHSCLHNTRAVLEQLQRTVEDKELLELFSHALRFCAPNKFSDRPPTSDELEIIETEPIISEDASEVSMPSTPAPQTAPPAMPSEPQPTSVAVFPAPDDRPTIGQPSASGVDTAATPLCTPESFKYMRDRIDALEAAISQATASIQDLQNWKQIPLRDAANTIRLNSVKFAQHVEDAMAGYAVLAERVCAANINTSGSPCPFCLGAKEICRNQPNVVEDLVGFTRKLQASIVSAEQKRIELKKVFTLLSQENRSLAKQIDGRPLPPTPPPPDVVCNLTHICDALTIEGNALRSEISSLVAQKQKELQQRLTAFRSSYDTPALDIENSKRLSALELLVNSLQSLGDTEQAEKQIEELSTILDSLPEATSPAAQADKVINSHDDPKAWLKLLECLLARGRSRLALLLYRQADCRDIIWSLNPASAADLACAITSSPSLHASCKERAALLADILGQMSAVDDYAQAQEPKHSLWTSIVLTFFASHLHSGEAAPLLYKFKATGTLSRSGSKLFLAMAEAIEHGRPIQIRHSELSEHIQQAETKINDLLKREGASYQHVVHRETKHWRHFQEEALFPAMVSTWTSLQSAACPADYLKSMHPDDFLSNLAKRRGGADLDHPHYRKEVQRLVRKVFDHMNDYAHLRAELIKEGDVVIDKQGLANEITSLGANIPNNFRNSLIALLDCPTDSDQAPQILIANWLLIDKDLITCALPPEIGTEVFSPSRPEEIEGAILIKTVLKSIAHPETRDSIASRWEERHMWMQAAALYDPNITADEERHRELTRKHLEMVADLRSYAIDSHSYTDAIYWAENLGCYWIARDILESHEKTTAEAKERELEDAQGWARTKRKLFESLLDKAYKGNSSDEWLAQFEKRIYLVLDDLRKVESGRLESPSKARRDETDSVYEIMKFNCDENAAEYAQVDMILRLDDQPPQPTFPEIRHAALNQAWTLYTKSNTADTKRWGDAWGNCFKEFAKCVGLLHNLDNEESVEWVRLGARHPLRAFKTKFHRARGMFFHKPIIFYPLLDPGNTPLHLASIKDAISTSPLTVFNVVLCPGIDDIHKATSGRSAIFIDSAAMQRLVCSSDIKEAFQQMLSRGVDPTLASPFVTEGYVHVDDGLFVGREKERQHLLKPGNYVLCGGRRIGKTSLLHAVQGDLKKQPEWEVTYLTAESLFSDKQDPDLELCRLIAEDRGWSSPTSISDFHDTAVQLLRTRSFALLLDEMDNYINLSRTFHGDGKFPFMRVLRALCQSNTNHRMKVIVAGFKQLYLEISPALKTTTDASYPFRNFMELIPLTQFNFEQAKALVQEGFGLMGIPLAEGVPANIYKYASGHPNFIQYFCKRLIDNASKRSGPLVITLRDVDNVHLETEQTGGGQSFASYFGSTLGLNLSPLGETILYIFATINIGIDRDPAEFHLRDSIVEQVHHFFSMCEIERPTNEEMDRTFAYLVMTGVLIEKSSRVKMAYPIYIKILHRLEEADQTKIFKLINKYDAEGRGRND